MQPAREAMLQSLASSQNECFHHRGLRTRLKSLALQRTRVSNLSPESVGVMGMHSPSQQLRTTSEVDSQEKLKRAATHSASTSCKSSMRLARHTLSKVTDKCSTHLLHAAWLILDSQLKSLLSAKRLQQAGWRGQDPVLVALVRRHSRRAQKRS